MEVCQTLYNLSQTLIEKAALIERRFLFDIEGYLDREIFTVRISGYHQAAKECELAD
jgi:hypothetical protein